MVFEGGIEGYKFVNACLVSAGLGDGVKHSYGGGDDAMWRVRWST